MSKEAIKLKHKLDKVFSLYIRKRDNYTCRRCGKMKPPGMIDAAHYITRNLFATRWDERNVVALCKMGCHGFLDDRSRQKEEFFKGLLGEEVCDELQELSLSIKKVGKEALMVYYKEKLEGME